MRSRPNPSPTLYSPTPLLSHPSTLPKPYQMGLRIFGMNNVAFAYLFIALISSFIIYLAYVVFKHILKMRLKAKLLQKSSQGDLEKPDNASLAKSDSRTTIQMEAALCTVKETDINRQKVSDTLASIDRVAQDLNTLPKGSESPKLGRVKSSATIDKNGALNLAVRSPSLERRHVSPRSATSGSGYSPTAPVDSKIDQLASGRINRNKSVRQKDGDSIPKSPLSSRLTARRKSYSLSHINSNADQPTFSDSNLANQNQGFNSSDVVVKSSERVGFNADALAFAMENMPAKAAADTLSTLVPAQALLTLKAMNVEQAKETVTHLDERIQQAFQQLVDSEETMGFNIIRLAKDADISPVDQIANDIKMFSPEQAARVLKVISSEEKKTLVLRQIENAEFRYEVKRILETL